MFNSFDCIAFSKSGERLQEGYGTLALISEMMKTIVSCKKFRVLATFTNVKVIQEMSAFDAFAVYEFSTMYSAK